MKYRASFIIAILLVGTLLGVLTWAILQHQTKNYAKAVADPLEKSLTKAGAVKKCSRGDAGRGSDNDSPWYEAYYELDTDRDKAAATIKEVAVANGYNLTQATPTNRGPVQVDDAYINNWFYNTVQKQ